MPSRSHPLRPTALLLLLVALAPAWARGEPEPGEVHQLEAAHGRSWSLYVPSKYSRRQSWPLVVSIHGRGGSGAGEIKPWRSLANEHGFIVACPDMVTATVGRPTKSDLPPSAEDDAVVLSIVEWIREHYRVNRRAVMITGFSGGGNPSYYTALRHPDVFTHVCTRGGNFSPMQVPRDDALRAAGKDLRILIFYGENDHPLIVGQGGQPGQAQMAYDALLEAGYADVTLEAVPGMKHESRPRKAAAWFGAYLVENERRFKYGDKVDRLLEDAHEDVEDGKTRNAIRHLLKARDIEERYELESVTAAPLDALEAEGRAKLEAARELHADDPSEAQRQVRAIARDYRGLAVAESAKAQRQAWR